MQRVIGLNRETATNSEIQISVWIIGIISLFNRSLLSISCMLGTANVNKNIQGIIATPKKLTDKAVIILQCEKHGRDWPRC